jgi:rhodanese-related sulfurtransferase
MKTRVTSCLVFLLSAPATLQAQAPPAPAAAPASEAPVPRITGADLQHVAHHADDELVILDARSPEEFAAGRVPEARNIPHDQVAARLTELAPLRDKTVVLYCRSGRRSGLAAKILKAAGFTDVRQLEGDFPGWEAAQRPVERGGEPATPSSN